MKIELTKGEITKLIEEQTKKFLADGGNVEVEPTKPNPVGYLPTLQGGRPYKERNYERLVINPNKKLK